MKRRPCPLWRTKPLLLGNFSVAWLGARSNRQNDNPTVSNLTKKSRRATNPYPWAPRINVTCAISAKKKKGRKRYWDIKIDKEYFLEIYRETLSWELFVRAYLDDGKKKLCKNFYRGNAKIFQKKLSFDCLPSQAMMNPWLNIWIMREIDIAECTVEWRGT